MSITPDPATATREELIALLMRAYDDTVALEKRFLQLEASIERLPLKVYDWQANRGEDYVGKPWRCFVRA